jgi:Protein of unknown function (DUF3109)
MSAMYNIDQVIFDDDVAGERFACDVNRCKGQCCTMYGERGAPLMDEELAEISKAFPKVVQFLPSMHREAIQRDGMVAGSPGNYATVCVDRGPCVFVYYEDSTARCSFEKAFFMGLIQWQKPLSCHLFPIRIRGNNPDHLYYEHIHQCLPGKENGMFLNISLIQFVKDALIRKYGVDWYNQAFSECKQVNKL